MSKKYTDGTYQDKVGKMVSTHIIWAANEFMTLVQEDIDCEWFESFDNIYDESVETIEDWFMYDCDEDIIEEHIYKYIDKKIDDDYTVGMALDDVSSEDKEELARQCGWEPSPHEILEWWIVSDWMADRLSERCEPVAKDFYGFNIWGRTCSGQAILLDGVICNIYDQYVRKGE